jgi:hypothetical protein
MRQPNNVSFAIYCRKAERRGRRVKKARKAKEKKEWSSPLKRKKPKLNSVSKPWREN